MRKLSSSRADLVLLLLGSLNGLKWLKTRQEPMRKCRWECNKTPAHSKHWQMWLQLLWPNKWVWFARSTYYLRGVNLKTKDSVCMWKAVHRYFIRAHWQGSTKEVNPTPSRVVCPSTVADTHLVDTQLLWAFVEAGEGRRLPGSGCSHRVPRLTLWESQEAPSSRRESWCPVKGRHSLT